MYRQMKASTAHEFLTIYVVIEMQKTTRSTQSHFTISQAFHLRLVIGTVLYHSLFQEGLTVGFEGDHQNQPHTGFLSASRSCSLFLRVYLPFFFSFEASMTPKSRMYRRYTPLRLSAVSSIVTA